MTKRLLAVLALLVGATMAVPVRAAADTDVLFARLTPETHQTGFRAVAVYRNATGQPIGARFVHEKTGFTLDLLRMQTAPQTFLWVNTPPTSDKGEPHTQEHLLLGKGNKGRFVASEESLSLASSSAYTEQWRTCYFFNTEAGSDVFFRLLEHHLDALLHPDYSDEEIRREVRNWGVTREASGELRLEEKGTVYNEMVSSLDRPGDRAWRAVLTALYGSAHPLSYEAGGTPEALRTLTPRDIRTFHDRQYRLGNMGMIAALPRQLSSEATLTRLNGMLNGLHSLPALRGAAEPTVPAFPAPSPAPRGSVFSVPYPDKNTQQPGDVMFVWPANRSLTPRDELLCGLFLDTIAGDPDTNLYKRFVNSATRSRDTGAQGVYGWLDSSKGFPIFFGLTGVAPSHRTESEMKQVRAEIGEELARVAAYGDGSPELIAFNRRLRSRLIARRRDLSKFVNSPPGFGFRGSSSGWMNHLLMLEREGGFSRSVTLSPQLQEIENLLRSDRKNLWRDYLATWKLTGTTPYIVTTRPDPSLIARQAEERAKRARGETVRLERQYGVGDPAAATARYQQDYDTATGALAKAEKGAPALRFVAHPPLTLDDPLDYRVTRLSGNIPLVASTFDDMTGATLGLALSLKAVPPEDQFLIPALPTLLTETGIVENGTPVSYETVLERQRREILSVGASFSINPTTNRVELLLTGSGNNAAESRRAVDWIRLLLNHPDWRGANLPRLSDLVDQSLAGLRNRMKGPEEYWVNGVSAAYYHQDNSLLLLTSSFLTQEHALHRLRWRLMDTAPSERIQAAVFLKETLAPRVGSEKATRATLTALASALNGKGTSPDTEGIAILPSGARHILSEAGKDLALILPDLPDDSLRADAAYLCRQMAMDLTVGPEGTLRQLEALRKSLLQTGGARLFVVGSRRVQDALAPNRDALLTDLANRPFPTVSPSESTLLIAARLKEREPDATDPRFVGLIDPNMQGGVFLNSARGTSWRNTDPDSLLRYLAIELYGGGGAEGIFMKTWAAGLAYSNGMSAGLSSGRTSYYAERTPELPQTLRFVIETLKSAPQNPRLVEYALAGAFGGRTASSYEGRGAAMADDLADGQTPQVVRTFRQALLAQRSRPDLTQALYARRGEEYAKVLPGYGPLPASDAKTVYFTIGPEKQFAAYETYLQSTVGPNTRLWRLYPRDFWIPVPLSSGIAAE